jgi:2-oxoglutarate ferredoxin oxidoreductase subunit beta
MLMQFPAYPVPVGVYYKTDREIFNLPASTKKTPLDLATLYRAKATWIKQ